MALSTNYLNDESFNSFFQQKIVDNNGIAVTDINLGLRNLFDTFNEKAEYIFESERYIVSDNDAGYPDLIAMNSILGSQRYWWWITLLNRLENPMTDFKSNWVYSINSQETINYIINASNDVNNSTNNSRIGKLVELN